MDKDHIKEVIFSNHAFIGLPIALDMINTYGDLLGMGGVASLGVGDDDHGMRFFINIFQGPHVTSIGLAGLFVLLLALIFVVMYDRRKVNMALKPMN